MTPREHLAKAERIMASLGRLRTRCPELEIEARMLAGTHLVNALLHARGLSSEDVTHAWGTDLGPGAHDAIPPLEAIEGLRPLYVRGAEPDIEAAVARAAAAYERIAALVD